MDMTKAVIYARVSSITDRQCTDRQVKDLQEYASYKSYEVVEVYTEHISGESSFACITLPTVSTSTAAKYSPFSS